MVLGFHYHQPAMQDAGRIQMTYFLGAFIDSIAPHFREVVLFLHGPAPAERAELSYTLQSRNVKLVELGRRRPVYLRLLLALRYRSVFRKNAGGVDVMLFRVSTVLLPFVASLFARRVFYFVSHASKGVELLKQPTHRLFLIKLWTRFYAARERALAHSSACITNSLELKAELEAELGRAVPLIPSTTLFEKDIARRPPQALHSPARLLYVGRISYLKGVLDILEAVRVLRATGHDVQLTMVGHVTGERGFQDEVSSFVASHGLQEHVHFAGFVGGGADLWQVYQQSDVFVTASRESEGFPRVIWEAMANGIPVVATDVGSISELAGNALSLVEPKHPEALAGAIAGLLRDDAERHGLVERGFECVGQNTLERRGEQLASWIRSAARP